MSDLQFRPGGSLKLKGGDESGKKKKSKKKNASKVALTGEQPIKSEALLKRVAEEDETVRRSISRDSPAASGSGSRASTKTEAERRFEQVQRKRLLDKVSKMASKTHKDRVQEFNSKLEMLSEHHDIPKVGPG